MTTRPKKPAPKRKQAANRRKDASPVNGVVPPEEYRFQPGQTGNPHGRPRKMADLQELIKDILAEEMTGQDASGRTIKMTRAIAMIRTMLIKSPSDRIALLEYAFGKVPQVNLDIYSEIARDANTTSEEAQEAIDQLARKIVDLPEFYDIAALPQFAKFFGSLLTGKTKVNSED